MSQDHGRHGKCIVSFNEEIKTCPDHSLNTSSLPMVLILITNYIVKIIVILPRVTECEGVI